MTVKVAAAQYPISTFNTLDDWKNHTENWVKEAAVNDAKIICFPEYGSMELVSIFSEVIQNDLTGQIEEMQVFLQPFKETFQKLASNYQTIIIAPSFPEKIGETFYNRAYVFSPNGKIGYQDKLFMTRFENEHWGISSPPKVLTLFKSQWGTFGIQICYDSEFALGTHHLASKGLEMLFVPSCTETLRGATRVHVGSRARAMEQQCYSIVSQTVGNALWSPAVDINYGYVGVYSTPDKNFPEDGILSTAKHQDELWHYAELDLSLLKTVQEDGQVFNYKDSQRLINQFQDEKIHVKIVEL